MPVRDGSPPPGGSKFRGGSPPPGGTKFRGGSPPPGVAASSSEEESEESDVPIQQFGGVGCSASLRRFSRLVM